MYPIGLYPIDLISDAFTHINMIYPYSYIPPLLLFSASSPPASANTHTHNNANVALSLMLKRRLGGIVHVLTQATQSTINTPC